MATTPCIILALCCSVVFDALGQTRSDPATPEALIASYVDGIFQSLSPEGAARAFDLRPNNFFVASAFSADGRRVVGLEKGQFVVLSDLLDPIWRVRATGRTIVNMALSPNGEEVAYLDLDPATRTETIRIARADGREETLDSFLLKDDRYMPASISWNPNGRGVLFSNGSEILAVDVETKVRQQIVSGSDPTWSPDGRWVAYRSAGGRLSIIDSATHEPRFKSLNPRIYSMAHWAPDSKYIFVDEDASGAAQEDPNCMDDSAIVVYRLADASRKVVRSLCGRRDWYFGWIANPSRWIQSAISRRERERSSAPNRP